jgi:hypothetical protein
MTEHLQLLETGQPTKLVGLLAVRLLASWFLPECGFFPLFFIYPGLNIGWHIIIEVKSVVLCRFV